MYSIYIVVATKIAKPHDDIYIATETPSLTNLDASLRTAHAYRVGKEFLGRTPIASPLCLVFVYYGALQVPIFSLALYTKRYTLDLLCVGEFLVCVLRCAVDLAALLLYTHRARIILISWSGV